MWPRRRLWVWPAGIVGSGCGLSKQVPTAVSLPILISTEDLVHQASKVTHYHSEWYILSQILSFSLLSLQLQSSRWSIPHVQGS